MLVGLAVWHHVGSIGSVASCWRHCWKGIAVQQQHTQSMSSPPGKAAQHQEHQCTQPMCPPQ
eukprot:scaffold265448_cov15-Tisochrysis_lutea.AAC.1